MRQREDEKEEEDLEEELEWQEEEDAECGRKSCWRSWSVGGGV